jgi:hypothetical protein
MKNKNQPQQLKPATSKAADKDSFHALDTRPIDELCNVLARILNRVKAQQEQTTSEGKNNQ